MFNQNLNIKKQTCENLSSLTVESLTTNSEGRVPKNYYHIERSSINKKLTRNTRHFGVERHHDVATHTQRNTKFNCSASTADIKHDVIKTGPSSQSQVIEHKNKIY